MRPGQSGSDVLGEGKWFTHRKFRWGEPARAVLKEAWQVYHPDRSEPFTVPELKRIFSYPDGFVMIGDWKDRSSRLGNSVPPLMMEAIASRVAAALAGAYGHAH
jgi:site-specific DNA-cytosine methylase